MQLVMAFMIGLVFGFGILVSGMASPAKVLNFFDFAGQWDPSLAFVMGGALLTYFFGYRLVFARPNPILEAKFHLPNKADVDLRLVGGSAIFGIGWGIAGFCPGGALPAIGTGRIEVFVFIAGLLAGILASRFIFHGRYLRKGSGELPPYHSK